MTAVLLEPDDVIEELYSFKDSISNTTTVLVKVRGLEYPYRIRVRGFRGVDVILLREINFHGPWSAISAFGRLINDVIAARGGSDG